MSIRAKFLGFVDVIMRIPPLFLLDEILKMSLFDSASQPINNLVAVAAEQLNETIINSTTASNLTEAASVSLDFYGLSLTLFKCLVFLIGKCLTRRKEKNLRKLFLQVVLVFFFCATNEKFHLRNENKNNGSSRRPSVWSLRNFVFGAK